MQGHRTSGGSSTDMGMKSRILIPSSLATHSTLSTSTPFFHLNNQHHDYYIITMELPRNLTCNAPDGACVKYSDIAALGLETTPMCKLTLFNLFLHQG